MKVAVRDFYSKAANIVDLTQADATAKCQLLLAFFFGVKLGKGGLQANRSLPEEKRAGRSSNS